MIQIQSTALVLKIQLVSCEYLMAAASDSCMSLMCVDLVEKVLSALVC